jgi:hypothetical protein
MKGIRVLNPQSLEVLCLHSLCPQLSSLGTMAKTRKEDNFVVIIMEALAAAGTAVSLIPWAVTQGKGSCLGRDWRESVGGGGVTLGVCVLGGMPPWAMSCQENLLLGQESYGTFLSNEKSSRLTDMCTHNSIHSSPCSCPPPT